MNAKNELFQFIIQKTKRDFIDYLLSQRKGYLIKKAEKLFDFELEYEKHVHIKFVQNNKIIVEDLISIDHLNLLPNVLEGLTITKKQVTLSLEYGGDKIFEKNIDVNNFSSLSTFLNDNKEHIFNEIGLFDVKLLYNKTKLIFDGKINIKNLLSLPELFQTYKKEIYNEYLGDNRGATTDVFYGDGDGVSYYEPITEILTGNFIIDEFGSFLSDENGAFVVF